MLAEQVVAKRLGELMKEKDVDIANVVEDTGLCRNTITKLAKGLERKVEFATLDRLKEDEEVKEFLSERNYPRATIDNLVDSQEQVKELIEQKKDMTIRYVQTFVYLLDTMDVAYPNWRTIAKPELEKHKNKINEVLGIKTK
ncbi:hypothetical protein CN495_07340 [Bacillus thuringiensis]|uniref:HTH cro/C1-type domain-containing protein n=1 Tax=Bacillus thuringiensis TaxID=1428 RepID=A0ABD6SAH9_BACTU|nr:helix-turn-helix transcriptional regulator [Bacillus thuringiensis]PER55559.1 hypothetical protein CN495_07340 [Bacillus thuringiensis]